MAKRQLSLEDFRADAVTGPALFAHDLDFDRQAMLFVRLTEQDYRRSSFLDDRILTAETEGAWIRLEAVSATISQVKADASLHYIFHSGHVGSTLLSRLLDAVPGVMGIREPLILRKLANAQDDPAKHQVDSDQLDRLLLGQATLWRRAFPNGNHSIVKATSSAVRIGPRLMTASPAAKAICLNVGLETYLATQLGGALSPLDLAGHRPERETRLAALIGPHSAAADTAGEQAALAWITESLSQARLGALFGDRVLKVDFDRLLNALPETLQTITAHFELPAPSEFFEFAPRSDVMRSYAKAPEEPYSPRVRAEVLAQARMRFADEILRGLRWADGLALQSPEVARLF